jgi:hypothetical protein
MVMVMMIEKIYSPAQLKYEVDLVRFLYDLACMGPIASAEGEKKDRY